MSGKRGTLRSLERVSLKATSVVLRKMWRLVLVIDDEDKNRIEADCGCLLCVFLDLIKEVSLSSSTSAADLHQPSLIRHPSSLFLLCYQYRKLKAQAKSLDSLQEAYSTLLAEKEHLERECTDLVAAETENQEKIRGLEERIEGMEKEYEALQNKLYSDRLDRDKEAEAQAEKNAVMEMARYDDLEQDYMKVMDELEELRESRDIEMLDTE